MKNARSRPLILAGCLASDEMGHATMPVEAYMANLGYPAKIGVFLFIPTNSTRLSWSFGSSPILVA
jgi:hypothetical protein